MLTILIDKLLKTQVVECAAVANWIFSGEMAHDFTRLGFLLAYLLSFLNVKNKDFMFLGVTVYGNKHNINIFRKLH